MILRVQSQPFIFPLLMSCESARVLTIRTCLSPEHLIIYSEGSRNLSNISPFIMGKSNAKKNQKRKGGCWGSDDFARRSYEQSKKQQKVALKQVDDESVDDDTRVPVPSQQSKSKTKKGKLTQQERSHLLSHGTEDQIEEKRLMLQISRTKREIEALRLRLESWDAVKEKKEEERRTAEEEKLRAEMEAIEKGLPKKRRKRPGPETWQLRGAARPAHEVYDFDVRYVDKHAKALEEDKEHTKRLINVLKIYRGKLGTEEAPQPYCRHFLGLLFQSGMLYIEKKKYKFARESFKECMELEGDQNPVTTSRQQLMRMYLETNRPESARRLWEKIPNDKSVWIRFSAALIEYVSFRILNEEGSSETLAENLLAMAIKSNVFCAFYLAFLNEFNSVMEYVDDIDDAKEGSVEEAIEYCNSDQIGHWYGTNGALNWIKSTLKRIWNGEKVGDCEKTDLQSWDSLITRIEYDFEANQSPNDESVLPKDIDEDNLDVLMYTGMFRTAMDMIIDSGELNS